MKLLKSDRGRYAFETDNGEQIWFKTKEEGVGLLATCYAAEKITLEKTIVILNKIILLTHFPITKKLAKPKLQIETEIFILENISCMQKIIETIRDKTEAQFPFLMEVSEKKYALVDKKSFNIFEPQNVDFDFKTDFDLGGDSFKYKKILNLNPTQAIKLTTKLQKQE